MNSIWIISLFSSVFFFLYMKEREDCNCFKEQALNKSLESYHLNLKILSKHIHYIQVNAFFARYSVFFTFQKAVSC